MVRAVFGSRWALSPLHHHLEHVELAGKSVHRTCPSATHCVRQRQRTSLGPDHASDLREDRKSCLVRQAQAPVQESTEVISEFESEFVLDHVSPARCGQVDVACKLLRIHCCNAAACEVLVSMLLRERGHSAALNQSDVIMLLRRLWSVHAGRGPQQPACACRAAAARCAEDSHTAASLALSSILKKSDREKTNTETCHPYEAACRLMQVCAGTWPGEATVHDRMTGPGVSYASTETIIHAAATNRHIPGAKRSRA